jgi:phage terminase large subunit-like protein
MPTIDLRPQSGPQERFLASQADIAIYGGAAGGGKSWALLVDPLRHALNNKEFGAVIFRRTVPQIRNEGALWDESLKIYSPLRGQPKAHTLEWSWPQGGTVSFSHLQYDEDVYAWQGGQICYLAFDELTHFTAAQFWYMLSRNRSMCGVRPYVRATCNPDPNSFVAHLIAWWIDQDTGYAIPSRSGLLRWFVRVNDALHWADAPGPLKARFPDAGEPKSLTFIGASIEDNQVLLRADPGYLANLNALPTVERERLKKGNWKIRDERLCIYKPSWWRIWPDDRPYPKILHVFASWDTAFTAADQRLTASGKPPDQSKIAYSACTVWGVWLDEKDFTKAVPGGRHKLLLLASWWGRVDWPDLKTKVAKIGTEKLTHPSDAHLIEKAASGQSLLQDLRRNPRQCRVIGVMPTDGDGKMDAKVLRAYLFQPYLKDGYVWAPNKQWARDTIEWLAAFPGGDPPSADLADTMSMAGQHLTRGWWIHHPDDDTEPTPPPEFPDDDDDPHARPTDRTGGRGYGAW